MASDGVDRAVFVYSGVGSCRDGNLFVRSLPYIGECWTGQSNPIPTETPYPTSASVRRGAIDISVVLHQRSHGVESVGQS